MILLKRLRFLLLSLGLIAVAGISFLYATKTHETQVFEADNPPKTSWSYARLSQGLVHYQLEGDRHKPLVVLVHGFSIPAYIWEPTYTYLRRQGFRVLRFDLYGRGFSSRPDIDYNMEDYVTQLDELLDHLGVDQPIQLIGLSMGGAVVAHYTAQYPDKVARLALLAPLVRSPSQAMLYPLLVPGLGNVLAEIAIVPRLRKGLSKAVFDSSSFPDWEQKLEPQTRYQGFSRAILRTARHLFNRDFTDVYAKLAALNKPTLLVWGKEDQTLPYQDHRLLLELFETIQFQSLEQCGHLPHYEHPQKVNAWLNGFLN
ncbi:MAG: hypothetical protein C9356_04750 [Oleiphilus sp.]|nr:MAG: hypothetical protein C9356_04750 [Oleiphilus sp.]